MHSIVRTKLVLQSQLFITGISLVVLAALAFVLLAAQGVSAAAGKIYVGSGTKILDPAKPVSTCNVAAVGTDKYGNRLALTAGHCSQSGAACLKKEVAITKQLRREYDKCHKNLANNQMTKKGFENLDKKKYEYIKRDVYFNTANGGRLGKVVSQMPVDGEIGFGANELDYAFIKLEPNVELRDYAPSPIAAKRITAPSMSMTHICKYGHGIVTTGERCGKVAQVNGNAFRVENMAMSAFDSGGPVYTNKTQVVGLVSSYAQDSGLGYLNYLMIGSPVRATRIDAIVRDATSKNWPGAGFKLKAE